MAYGSELNEEAFKDKLGRCSIKELTRSAAERRNGSLGFAEAFKDMAYPYLNVTCYDSGKILSVADTISKLSRIINRYKKIKNVLLFIFICLKTNTSVIIIAINKIIFVAFNG